MADFTHYRIAIPLIAGCAILASCKSDRLPVYSAFADTDPRLWQPGQFVELYPAPQDSTRDEGLYNAVLAIRYTLKAPDTLRLVTSTVSFESSEQTDTIAIPLRQPDKKPAGRGSHGFYTLSSPLPPLWSGKGDDIGTLSSLPPGLRVSINPLSPVAGIASIGIIVVNSK